MNGPLLILRPEPGAGATAARAAARGLATIVAPLFVIRPRAWTPPAPSDFDALILTSANAVRQAGAALAGLTALPVYAVGAATAAAARQAGFATIHAGEADATALAKDAARNGAKRALHLAGRDHRALVAEGLAIDTRMVYASTAARALPAEMIAACRAGGVALLHSPRAATLFRALAEAAGLAVAEVRVAAISPAALAAAGDGWRASAVAAMPTDDALLDAALRLCDQRAREDG